jgi:hypothetical protein
MNITREILSFRYNKNYIFNRYKRKKNKKNFLDLSTESHSYCPVCSSTEGYLIAEVDRIGVLCDTVVCKDCDFVFNNSFISNTADFYQNKFAEMRWGDPEANFIKRTSLNSFSQKRFQFISNTFGDQFDEIHEILEIGCGDGCNLLPFHLIGKSTTGCDLSKSFLEPGLNRGLNLIKGEIGNINKNTNYDLIMLIHSFEHFLDLDAIVQAVYERLGNKSFVYVEVPGIIGWHSTMKKSSEEMGLKSTNNFLEYLQFEHNYHFSLESLRKIWERNGFDLVYGDEWVRAIFCKKGKKELLKTVSHDKNKIDIRQHLIHTEKDFLTLNNILIKIMSKLFRKDKDINL